MVIHGTCLYFRNHVFDDYMYRMGYHKTSGDTKFHIFDRGIFGKIMFQDLDLQQNSGHAPLILNIFAAQRLVQFILSASRVPVTSAYILSRITVA